MTLLILTFLILGCLITLCFKRRRIAGVFAGLTLVWIFATGCGLIPTYLLAGLQVQPPFRTPKWEKRNVIVVLTGGAVKWPKTDFVSTNVIAYSRVLEAALLYFSCKRTGKDCRVLISGGNAARAGLAECEVVRRELDEVNVADSDILLESNSHNTFQNARFASAQILSRHFDLIVLVTSGIHMMRALKFFSYFHVPAIPAPSDHLRAIWSPTPISYNFTMADLSIHEYIGILQFHIYNFMGWNTTP